MTSQIIPVKDFDFFHEAIMTLPLRPKYCDFSYSVFGMPTAGDYDKYLKECEQRQVIPYTSLKLVYDWNINTFKQRNHDPLELARPRPEDADKIRNILMKGGRFANISVQISLEDANTDAFDKFRNSIMSEFYPTHGYVLNKADIWLSHYHLTEYNEGDYASDEIYISADSGLRLNLEGRLQKDDEEKILAWFNALKAKHVK